MFVLSVVYEPDTKKKSYCIGPFETEDDLRVYMVALKSRATSLDYYRLYSYELTAPEFDIIDLRIKEKEKTLQTGKVELLKLQELKKTLDKQ